MEKKNPYNGLMRAVFLDKPEGHLIVRETEIPVPEPGEVLIKIKASPINPSDIAGLRKPHDETFIKHFVPGIEGSGVVVSAGKGLLPRFWLGKRVACSSAGHTSGTWAEYLVTKAGMCFPLNKNISDDQGSMSLVNPLTALSFFEIAKQNRHTAIINNAASSALGRMVELIGDKKKIPVINIVRSNKQVLLLKGAGSKYVLDSSEPDFILKLGELSSELKATLLFDSVCSPLLKNIIEVLPHGSRVVIYGNLTRAENILINPRSIIDNNINISGFFLGEQSKKNGMIKNLMNLREVSHLMKTGMKIKIQKSYPLELAQEALDTYQNNMTAGKVLLIPGG